MTEKQSDTSEKTPVELATEFLTGLMEKMDIDAEIVADETEDKLLLDIRCDHPERVVGKRGQVIDAIQHLVTKISYRDYSTPRGKPIIVDAGGYRAKHIDWLESLAERMSEKALSTDTVVELNPMTAHDRRIVHMALANKKGITTRSEGEGKDRHVLVVPDTANETPC